jgi:hypothetical protein
LFNFARKVALALTSDLFYVLLPLLHGTKSEFLKIAMTFWERLLLNLRHITAKLAKMFRYDYSEKQFKRT